MKLSEIARFGSLADIWALSDVDLALLQGGWVGVAQVSNHGQIRNRLYFDWHVKSFKGTNYTVLD
jgi:hypothetical protein